jgi:hypothetical protein
MKGGARWWSNTTQPPANWNAIMQLADAKILPVEISGKDASTMIITTSVGWRIILQPIAGVA